MPKAEVPWANNDKDERYVEAPIATGLWTRYGNVVHAPDWFLDGLPNHPLDGEIWAEGMSRQVIRSIAAKLVPGEEWSELSYHVFNVPYPSLWLQDGEIRNTNFNKVMKGCYEFFLEHGGVDLKPMPFSRTYTWLQQLSTVWPSHLVLVEQQRLPYVDPDTRINELLETEMSKLHGEGLILTDPALPYGIKRVAGSLKVKPRDDAEATVIGYVTGRETDKGSKLLGMMGALIVEWEGITFELHGFKESERVFDSAEAQKWAYKNPETKVPDCYTNPTFPRGTVVTFKYRGTTDDGVPQEATYWRKYDEL